MLLLGKLALLLELFLFAIQPLLQLCVDLVPLDFLCACIIVSVGREDGGRRSYAIGPLRALDLVQRAHDHAKHPAAALLHLLVHFG